SQFPSFSTRIGEKIMNAEDMLALQLRTREAPKISYSGMETLDLSNPKPEPTAHLSLVKSDGSRFQKKSKDSSQDDAWRIGAEGDGLQFKLSLPFKHGINLILEVSRASLSHHHGHSAETPLTINVNGDHEWGVEIDPRSLNFQKQLWYLPHYML